VQEGNLRYGFALSSFQLHQTNLQENNQHFFIEESRLSLQTQGLLTASLRKAIPHLEQTFYSERRSCYTGYCKRMVFAFVSKT
jgi:hypothetical protein